MALAEELDFDAPVLSCMRRSYIGMPILKLWILFLLVSSLTLISLGTT